MDIFKTRTLTWRQISGIKVSALAVAFLFAHYWPAIDEWTTFWWTVLVVALIYVFSFRFKK